MEDSAVRWMIMKLLTPHLDCKLGYIIKQATHPGKKYHAPTNHPYFTSMHFDRKRFRRKLWTNSLQHTNIVIYMFFTCIRLAQAKWCLQDSAISARKVFSWIRLDKRKSNLRYLYKQENQWIIPRRWNMS